MGEPGNGPRTTAAAATRARFGTLPDGREIDAITLDNGLGMTARVITYGASLESLVLPDRVGRRDDVVLAPRDLADYVARPQFFGATVGRFANRIAKGRFVLDGHIEQLTVNDRGNSLHGGTLGFDKFVWEVIAISSDPVASVTLRYASEDGDQGYPGAVTAEAIYALDAHNQLTITYTATTSRPTIVNLSNHSYWNLAGEGRASGAMGHSLTIPAETYLPTDDTAIPTGEFRPVAGTPFDFRAPHPVGERVRDAGDAQIVIGRGYDHNWVVGQDVTEDQHLMARLADAVSGRSFELWSNQPGLQFYSGNFLDGTTIGKSGALYRAGMRSCSNRSAFPIRPTSRASALLASRRAKRTATSSPIGSTAARAEPLEEAINPWPILSA